MVTLAYQVYLDVLVEMEEKEKGEIMDILVLLVKREKLRLAALREKLASQVELVNLDLMELQEK